MSDDTGTGPLDPDELDITDSDSVQTLGDDRFVVSTGDGPPRSPAPSPSPPSPDEPARNDGEGTDAAAGRRAETLAASGDDYGFDVVFAFDGETSRLRTGSDDVAETFEALLVAFARNAGGDLPPAETLGVLLGGMDTPVRIPGREIHRAIVAHDLSRDDSIGDLLAAVRDEGGLTLK